MALSDLKITDQQVLEKGVVNAPDKLTGRPEDNKRIFDRLIREAVKGVYNGLIDALTAPSGAGEIGTKLGKTLAAALLSEDVDALRLNEDGAIEVRRVGSDQWTATGSSGHLILGPDGATLPQRSRMQFANCIVEDNGTVTIVRGVTGPKGDKGDKGDTGTQGPTGPTGPTGKSIIPNVDQNTGLMTFTEGPAGVVPAAVNVRGPQGPQGVQGSQGAVGPQGLYGPQGLPGDPGPRGIEGPQGPRGPQGEQGAQGPIGLQGPQGLRGDKGDKGDKGDTGDAGAKGSQGVQGIQGLQGPRGEQGIPGPAGAQGTQGLQGLKGDRGLDGRSFEIEDVYPTLAQLQTAFPTGSAGAYQVTANMELYIWSEANLAWQSIGALEGPQGPTGPEGPQGSEGPQGEIGPQGPEGVQGPKGDQGIQGLKGDKGDKGDTGPKGDKGDTGEQGLQGIQGQKGDQGPEGDQGIQGQKGDTGATGPKGDPAKINGELPDESGNFTLTAAKVGAEAVLSGAPTKAYPVDADGMVLIDNADNKTKRVSWSVIKSTLLTWLNTLYAAVTHTHSPSDLTSAVPISKGGTGATTAAAARTALAALAAFAPVSITISTTWSGTGPWTQNIAVSGVLAAWDWRLGLHLSKITDDAARKLQEKAFGCIAWVETYNGGITLTCRDKKPDVAISAVLAGEV